MHTPLTIIAVAYVAGLVFGHGFLYFPFTIGSLTIVLLLVAGLLTLRRMLTRSRYLLFTLPLITGMIAYGYSAAWVPADHYTRPVQPRKSIHEFIGTISSSLERDPDRTAFVVSLEQIDNHPASGKLHVSVREQTTRIGYHDTIRFSAKLIKPRSFNNPRGFDYAAYLALNGIFATTSIKRSEEIQVLVHGSGIVRTIYAWRERIRQAFLASTTSDGSAILQAMTLGEEGGLTDALRDRFMAAGVTHIISISGSHLGMVSLLCFGLIRWLLFLLPERHYHRLTLHADPRKIAALLTLPLVIFYTLLAGGQVATVRSLIMIAAGLFALLLDREHALIHSLSLAAFAIVVVSPQAIFDISFQLSFLSVLVIGAIATLWSELHIDSSTRFRKVRNSVLLMVAISLATSLATGPLVAHYFNQVSFAGIVANMVVVPFAGIVVVPLGLFSGISSLFLHRLPLAALNQAAADSFVATVTLFARLPFAELHTPSPGLLWMFAAFASLASLFVVIRSRLFASFTPFETSLRPPRSAWYSLGISVSVLLVITFIFLHRDNQTSVLFPDVGQGDCSLLRLASGECILIDGGGTRDNRFDIGRRVLAPLLWNNGIRKLDLVILTHPHPDHMNGLLYILKTFPVREVWTHGFDEEIEGYNEFLNVIADRKISHRIVSSDVSSMMIGTAELRVLHPDMTFEPHVRKPFDAENNRSLVVRIADSGHAFLFAGDIGAPAERYLVAHGRDLGCDVLKVPHHGSKSSSTAEFVAAARPRFAVITVGRGNPYHHPSDEVVERYVQDNAAILRTDEDGAVTITTSSEGLSVTRWNDYTFKRIKLEEPGTWGAAEIANANRITAAVL